MHAAATGAPLAHVLPFLAGGPRLPLSLLPNMQQRFSPMRKWKEALKQSGGLRSNSPHAECKASPARVCEHREGDGDLTNAWWEGTAPSTLPGFPNGYFVHCPFAPTASPPPFLPFFWGEFILSRAHCGGWRGWLAEGRPGACWLTLVSATQANVTPAGIWRKKTQSLDHQ